MKNTSLLTTLMLILFTSVANVAQALYVDNIIVSTEGDETTYYLKSSANNYWWDANTAPTQSLDEYGEYAFYAASNVLNGYYIKSVSADKWLTYSSTNDGKDIITLSDTQDQPFQIVKNDNYYTIRPFNNSYGDPFSYLNWHGGPSTYQEGNTMGLYNNTNDVGGRWMIIAANKLITSASKIDENKYYTIVPERGAMTVLSDGSGICSATNDNASAEDGADKWRFTSDGNGKYYLYNLWAGKYLTSDGTFSDVATAAFDVLEIDNAEYKYCLKLKFESNTFNNDGSGNFVINSYSSEDQGNRMSIHEATTNITWTVVDEYGKTEITETLTGCLEGIAYTPQLLKTYPGIILDQSAITATKYNQAITTTYSHSGVPFKYSKSFEDATWYQIKVRNNKYSRFDGTNIVNNTSAPSQLLSSDLFAFVGTPFSFRLYNGKAGADAPFGPATPNGNPALYYNTTADNAADLILEQSNTSKFPNYMLFRYISSETGYINDSNSKLAVWDSPNNRHDAGSNFAFIEVPEDVASAIINSAATTITIEDEEGNVLGTKTIDVKLGSYSSVSDEFVAAIGIPYYDFTLKTPVTIVADADNAATLIAKWVGPFNISETLDEDASWYAFNVRQTNIGLVTNEGTMNVTTSYSLDDVLADDVWAFKGNNISGFSIYNKKSGRYLTKPVKPEADQTDPDKYCYLSDTSNNDWLIMPTGDASANDNGAFLLYEKTSTKNKLNQFGGATYTTLGYYDSNTDPGNFFYTSSPINFVKTVISEILENPVGLINGFGSEDSKNALRTKYEGLSSSETLKDFTDLYYELLDALIKQTTGWYQLENQYTANKYVLEASADGALIGQHTLAEAANDINTFVKYDTETKTVMLQGQYVPTHGTADEGAVLSENGGHISFNPVTGGSCLLGFVSDDVDAGNPYRYLYFNYINAIYTLRAWHSTTNASNTHWYMHPKSSFDITLHEGAAGQYWATMYAPFGYTLPAGVEAYIGTVNEAKNSLCLESIGQDVPAGTPVVLMGSNATVTVTINDEAAATIGENDLIGQYLAYTEQSDELYTLGISDGVVGFYKYDGIIGANKAVLKLTDGAASNGFKLVFGDDDLTGLSGITTAADAQSATYYDLQGRRVVAPQKGQLYIKNGKTIVY